MRLFQTVEVENWPIFFIWSDIYAVSVMEERIWRIWLFSPKMHRVILEEKKVCLQFVSELVSNSNRLTKQENI